MSISGKRTGFLVLTFAFAVLCGPALAQSLPQRIAPQAPFPKILTQAPTLSFIAPGVTEGEYDLQTVAGPIVVHAVAIDLRRSDLHVGTVLAHDKLVSSGETVESMAKRTGAIAGINGDYFDINGTNAPLNILIANSQLLHPPMQRYALGIDATNGIHFQEYFDPPNDIVTAIGGGPLLLRDGTWYDDPDGPNGAEFLQRIPASGVAGNSDDTLFLIQVDGNQPDYSVGVTRPEFAALMRALGATDGMALDGGGSSTLVARIFGNTDATLQNSPSDGRERPVADGLFVYSDAPAGNPARIAAQPATIRAVVGAMVPAQFVVTDDAGHVVAAGDPVQATVGSPNVGSISSTQFAAVHPGRTMLYLRSGSLTSEVPVTVVRSPSRIVIFAASTNFEPGEQTQFIATAYDENGYPLRLPQRLDWRATRGSIAPDGTYTASSSKAIVSVRIGSAVATLPITVGYRQAPFSIGDRLSFFTAPKGGAGGVTIGVPSDPANPGASCATCVQIAYDFSGSERAAYARIDKSLPSGTLGLAFDIFGNNSNAIVRVKLVNAIDESVLLTATRLNFTGWRHVTIRFPATLVQPAKFSSIYILNGIGAVHVTTAGTIVLRNIALLRPAN